MKLKKEVARKNNLEIYTYNQFVMYSVERWNIANALISMHNSKI